MKQSKTKLAIQNIKHIGIVGSGIAGLTFANSLVKRYNDLRYYEKLKLPKISIVGNSQNHSPRGLGLWPNSIYALKELGLETFIHESALKIPSAAYRSMSGNWLSKCSPTKKNHERVCTIKENELLTNLKNNIINIPEIEIIHGDVFNVTQVVNNNGDEVDKDDSSNNINNNKNINKFEISYHENDDNTKTTIQNVDFLIGADGMNSITRQSETFRNNNNNTNIVKSNFFTLEGILSPNSNVFREKNISEIPLDILNECQYPFESLGQYKGMSVRFACIPLKFDSLFYFATVPYELFNDDVHNNNEIDVIFQLQNIFKDFHGPIPNILEFIRKHDLNVNRGTVYQDEERGRIDHMDINQQTEQAYLLGDAWHVERHNLAQGASISIEDAWELAYVLSSEDTLLNAQNRFCELREERINNYRLFTGFTDFISHLDNFGQVSELRNRLMQFVPTSINERIFDFSLDQSLGGKGYTLQR